MHKTTLLVLASLFFFLLHANSVAMDSDAVRSAQTMLIELGFEPGQVDGISGPKTRKAIRLFQANSDRHPKTGVLDEATLDALREQTRHQQEAKHAKPMADTLSEARTKAPASEPVSDVATVRSQVIDSSNEAEPATPVATLSVVTAQLNTREELNSSHRLDKKEEDSWTVMLISDFSTLSVTLLVAMLLGVLLLVYFGLKAWRVRSIFRAAETQLRDHLPDDLSLDKKESIVAIRGLVRSSGSKEDVQMGFEQMVHTNPNQFIEDYDNWREHKAHTMFDSINAQMRETLSASCSLDRNTSIGLLKCLIRPQTSDKDTLRQCMEEINRKPLDYINGLRILYETQATEIMQFLYSEGFFSDVPYGVTVRDVPCRDLLVELMASRTDPKILIERFKAKIETDLQRYFLFAAIRERSSSSFPTSYGGSDQGMLSS